MIWAYISAAWLILSVPVASLTGRMLRSHAPAAPRPDDEAVLIVWQAEQRLAAEQRRNSR